MYLESHEFPTFKVSRYYTRYLQWKFKEVTTKLEMEDFMKYRIIGRGGFGEVHACMKNDTGPNIALLTR